MKNPPQLPDIPEGELTPSVKTLLALLEQYSTRIVFLEGTVADLKNEINILKCVKKHPKFEPSKWANQPTGHQVALGTKSTYG